MRTGNRTRTGIWKVQYNAQNRAIGYEAEADFTHISVRLAGTPGGEEGAVFSYGHCVYRGYLQVAAYDLLAEGQASLWQIIQDPT